MLWRARGGEAWVSYNGFTNSMEGFFCHQRARVPFTTGGQCQDQAGKAGDSVTEAWADSPRVAPSLGVLAESPQALGQTVLEHIRVPDGRGAGSLVVTRHRRASSFPLAVLGALPPGFLCPIRKVLGTCLSPFHRLLTRNRRSSRMGLPSGPSTKRDN